MKTEPEHEPEPEPDSDCRYLSYFRLFSTLRMSRPAALDDVLLFLAVSYRDPFFGLVWTRDLSFSGSWEHTTINTEIFHP